MNSIQTNAVLRKDSELYLKAQILLEAATEYWREYKKHFAKSAVIYLQADSGLLLTFTRGEYKRALMEVIEQIDGEPIEDRLFYGVDSERAPSVPRASEVR